MQNSENLLYFCVNCANLVYLQPAAVHHCNEPVLVLAVPRPVGRGRFVGDSGGQVVGVVGVMVIAVVVVGVVGSLMYCCIRSYRIFWPPSRRQTTFGCRYKFP